MIGIKRIFACLVICSTLTGCAIFTVFTMLPGAYLLFPASYYLVYELEGKKVDDIYTSVKPVRTLPASRNDNEELEFSWRLTNLQISFRIKNNTKQPIEIYWAQSRISVDKRPPEHLVANNHVHTEDHKHSLDMPEYPQKPSVLLPLRETWYGLFPYSHSKFHYFTNASNGHWGVKKVLWDTRPDKHQTSQERQAIADLAIGRKVQISIPMMLNGENEIFVFYLRVSNVTVKRVNW